MKRFATFFRFFMQPTFHRKCLALYVVVVDYYLIGDYNASGFVRHIQKVIYHLGVGIALQNINSNIWLCCENEFHNVWKNMRVSQQVCYGGSDILPPAILPPTRVL